MLFTDEKSLHEVPDAGMAMQSRPLETMVSLCGDGNAFHPLSRYRAVLVRYVDADAPQNRILFDALAFAYHAHRNIFRKSREPYINHPVAVAEILAGEFQLRDPLLLAAALLHDAVEDEPDLTIRDIEGRFGVVVAQLVDGCTKLERQRMDRAALKDLTHSKIFLHASQRLGVLLIKLADRLHNIRTLKHLPQAKRRRISQETLDVYVPIAAKLNLFPLKRELHKRALSFLYPRKSKKIMNAVRGSAKTPEAAEIKKILEDLYKGGEYRWKVRVRAKDLGAYYSPIKRTLEMRNVENQVDFTLVIDAEEPLSCYTLLGAITTQPMFMHVPNSIRDYVAMPKNNGYQSLHVKLKYKGQAYLVKIRTRAMDMTANYGILHHWRLTESPQGSGWEEISEMLQSIGEYGGSAPRRKDLIRLAGSEETFVFTPKGDIHYLPRHSIVLDFAYKVHSTLGNHCEGAYVNGEWASITRPLQEGDTVEIIKSPNPVEVDTDLEEICKTPKARSAVNKQLNKRRLIYAEKIGREIMRQEILRCGLSESALFGETMQLVLEFFHIKDLSQMLVRIGQDTLSPREVLYYFEKPGKPPGKPNGGRGASETAVRSVITVDRIEKGVHKFSMCCNPYPGFQRTVAALSERGVAFHRSNCRKIREQTHIDPQKLLAVEWDLNSVWRQPLYFELKIFEKNRSDFFHQLALVPPETCIRRIKNVGSEASSGPFRLELVLHSFLEGRRFFRVFPPGIVAIENYGREKPALQP